MEPPHRLEQEEALLEALLQAKDDYQLVQAEYQELQDQFQDAPDADRASALAFASQIQREVLERYIQALEVFTRRFCGCDFSGRLGGPRRFAPNAAPHHLAAEVSPTRRLYNERSTAS